MSIQDLRGLVGLLEESGELCRIPVEVDPILEVAEITNRVCKGPGGGKALFFEKVKGHRFPVLTNLFGSPRRTAWALWTDTVEALAGRLARELERAPGGDAEERLRHLVDAPQHQPVLVAKASCREVVHAQNPTLFLLPALKSWPQDGGRFLTLPLVFTRDPASGRSNCGMYRVQIFEERTAGIHFGTGSDGFRHYTAWQARGKPMPVAIAIGGDPALIYAAGAPLPSGIEEASFAGYLRQKPVEMTKCLGSDLAVPAAAEFVIEGFLNPGETRLEGPFGNHTGYYAPTAPCPAFHVTAITHREDALYPCTVVGPPPMEDCFLAKATERLFLPLLKTDFPDLVDWNLPLEGIFHGCALVSIHKRAPGQGKEMIRALWRASLLKEARLLVILDADVDVQNLSESFWRTVNDVQPDRDLLVNGNRLGIDATRKVQEEEGPAEREPVGMIREVKDLVDARWGEYRIK